MPEGVECRVIAESLARRISNQTLQVVDVVSGRYTKKPMTGKEILLDILPSRVVGVGVHGKFIYWILQDEVFIWSTLGMTGQWSEETTKHTRVKFGFSDREVFFNDQRNFGTLKIVRGKFRMIEKLKSLGPDILQSSTTFDIFLTRIRKKNKWEITKALLDQSIIAGVGNYIKADALWKARISPLRTVESLTDDDLEGLFQAVKDVAERSYSLGGASIRTYRNFEGRVGDYSKEFLVYNQKYDSLGNLVERLKTKDGRTTHWAPKIQV